MATEDDLYQELLPDIRTLSDELFALSEALLRKNGNFLPHGGVLTNLDELKLVTAGPASPGDISSSEVLPLLHEELRRLAAEQHLKAVAVSENVTITAASGRPTDAIKVLYEHERGLTTAFYLPFEKRLFRGYMLGEVFAVPAKAEVKAWG